MPATRNPKVSLAALTIVPALALAPLAHCLQEQSVMCQETRRVNVLLTLSEKPQTLDYGIDDYLKSKSNHLNRS
jgi:hypothetical protein